MGTSKLQDDIEKEADDELYELKKKIQKKYNITWASARDHTNWALRVLMLGFPEEWIKK